MLIRSRRRYVGGGDEATASKLAAQLLVVVLCAAAVKLHYSTAGVDQLRWILAPTACLVELYRLAVRI